MSQASVSQTSVMQRLEQYYRLMRLDRPIGTFLLLWPTLWALWIASEGQPHALVLVVFVVGVFVMRSAGCVINDFADRKIDRHVERTKERPLTSGKISAKEALALFVVLLVLAFLLVLLMNNLTILLSLAAVVLASVYPFMKRYTHLPQVVLGMAFAWAIPMAFAAERSEVPAAAWLIYLATVLWTVAYDTMYAMVDRNDDLKIGVKSAAILFGRYDRLVIGLLQLGTLACLYAVGVQFELGPVYYLSLALGAVIFIYQQTLIFSCERSRCFKAFLNNNWFGAVVFAGLLLNYLP